jgi:hypothetical protein
MRVRVATRAAGPRHTGGAIPLRETVRAVMVDWLLLVVTLHH